VPARMRSATFGPSSARRTTALDKRAESLTSPIRFAQAPCGKRKQRPKLGRAGIGRGKEATRTGDKALPQRTACFAGERPRMRCRGASTSSGTNAAACGSLPLGELMRATLPAPASQKLSGEAFSPQTHPGYPCNCYNQVGKLQLRPFPDNPPSRVEHLGNVVPNATPAANSMPPRLPQARAWTVTPLLLALLALARVHALGGGAPRFSGVSEGNTRRSWCRGNNTRNEYLDRRSG
jgi:hypothetical protein